MSEYSSEAHEVLQRARRIETRLMKLCNFLGLDPARDRDRVIVKKLTPLTLDLSGLDVSIGDLLDTCRRESITHTVMVEHKGVLLATIILGERDGNTAGVVAADGTQVVG
jgi:hypothetical protein